MKIKIVIWWNYKVMIAPYGNIQYLMRIQKYTYLPRYRTKKRSKPFHLISIVRKVRTFVASISLIWKRGKKRTKRGKRRGKKRGKENRKNVKIKTWENKTSGSLLNYFRTTFYFRMRYGTVPYFECNIKIVNQRRITKDISSHININIYQSSDWYYYNIQWNRWTLGTQP